jgi:hypothetical protein
VYGIVNKAIEDLAVSVGGPETWEAIRQRAGVVTPTFVSLDSYDDAITYRLVGAASEVLGMPADDILEAFGRHWILYTGRQGYGPLLSAAGTDVRTFLGNLGGLHARVRLTMPELQPPTFRVEDDGPDRLLVHYYSHRQGLGAMVVGLLRGLGDLLGQEVTVERIPGSGEEGTHEVFVVGIGAAPAESGIHADAGARTG